MKLIDIIQSNIQQVTNSGIDVEWNSSQSWVDIACFVSFVTIFGSKRKKCP